MHGVRRSDGAQMSTIGSKNPDATWGRQVQVSGGIDFDTVKRFLARYLVGQVDKALSSPK